MPWAPELFTVPVLQKVLDQRERDRATAVPFFAGLLSGEPDALVESFAGEPELHDPVQGRIRGERAFRAFVAERGEWLERRGVTVESLGHQIIGDRGYEEVVLRLDGDRGPIALPVAIVVDRTPGHRIAELRTYFSSWPVTGRHAVRTPLLQRDPDLTEADVVGEYQRALAAGDADAILATFEPDGYAREPAGEPFVHRGADGLRAFYEHLFSNGGGIPLEHCTVTDDGRTCVLEYNVVRWGRTELPPQAGVAVYVRGASGRLAAARIYDDADPPLA
jgi:hypothetical protein